MGQLETEGHCPEGEGPVMSCGPVDEGLLLIKGEGQCYSEWDRKEEHETVGERG